MAGRAVLAAYSSGVVGAHVEKGERSLFDRSHHRRKKAVLPCLNACMKRVFVIALENGHSALGENRAGVDPCIDQVHRAPRDARTVCEGLPWCMQPREGGQQRRVYIHDVARKVRNGLFT